MLMVYPGSVQVQASILVGLRGPCAVPETEPGSAARQVPYWSYNVFVPYDLFFPLLKSIYMTVKGPYKFSSYVALIFDSSIFCIWPNISNSELWFLWTLGGPTPPERSNISIVSAGNLHLLVWYYPVGLGLPWQFKTLHSMKVAGRKTISNEYAKDLLYLTRFTFLTTELFISTQGIENYDPWEQGKQKPDIKENPKLVKKKKKSFSY